MSDLSSQSQPNVTSSPSAASCSQPPPHSYFSLSLGMLGTQSDFVLPTLDSELVVMLLTLGGVSLLANILGCEELSLSCKAIWQLLLDSFQRQSSSEECVLVSPHSRASSSKNSSLPQSPQ